jgi:hypothetical protein
MVLCLCSGPVFYWPVGMGCIVFLYSFCCCGLTFYGECGPFTSGCVELLNLNKHSHCANAGQCRDN